MRPGRKRPKKLAESKPFPQGWRLAKRRQQALRYFELFLADNRVPLAQAYHQIHWIGREHAKLLKYSFALPVAIEPSSDWDGSLQLELKYRSDAAESYLTSIRALASTSALTLTFTMDAAAELLRSDLKCAREEVVPGDALLAGYSLFELLRAGSNWARHHRAWPTVANRTKALNWNQQVLKDIGLAMSRPGELGTLEKLYLKLPFPTWLALEQRIYSEAQRLVMSLIKDS